MNIRGLEIRGHVFRVPLDHAQAGGEELELFAREVRAPGKSGLELPWLVFLQGGPGFESPRPLGREGWIDRAVERFRVLLLDQRGTGRSTALAPESILARGDADAQAQHLALFRADSIVRDLECIRSELGVSRWTLLGQSFGGFCCVHYLSVAPESLDGAMITGGLPGLGVHADDVYRETYAAVEKKNDALQRSFPEIGERIRRVFERVREGDVHLPSGDLLTMERLQVLGLQLGFSTGAPQIHYLFERAFIPGTRSLTRAFLRGIESNFPFDTNPLYALLHEACYGQGPATRWSAHRIREEFPRLDAAAALDRGDVPLFTGEMVYPWYLEQCAALEPLRDVADALARREDWASLYDPEALERIDVPVAALVFHGDMFVPTKFSLETASRIAGLEPWVTSEYEHDGLRGDGGRIFDRLLADLGR